MKKIFCPSCGEELKENENFCHFCGEKVTFFLEDNIDNEQVEKLDKEIEEIENEIKEKLDFSQNTIKEETPKIEEPKGEIKEKLDFSQNTIKEETPKIEEPKGEIKETSIENSISEKPKLQPNEYNKQEENGKKLVKKKTTEYSTTKNQLLILLAVVLFSGGMFAQNMITIKPKKVETSEETDNKSIEKTDVESNITNMNEGYALINDTKNGMYYIVNEEGKVVKKFEKIKIENITTFVDGYITINKNIYNTNFEKVLDNTGYNKTEYVGDGLVIVTEKENETLRNGIYDLQSKEYRLEPRANIDEIKYLDEDMFLITMNKNKYMYNSTTNSLYDASEFYDNLIGKYNNGYIVYKNSTKNEVYLIDRLASKKLITINKDSKEVGIYKDGVIFVKDAFYDANGNKVLDLKNEKITNTPEFVNGYALLIMDNKYFTVVEKETGKYMFDPKQFVYVNNDSKSEETLGLYTGQTYLSSDGFLLVKNNTYGIMNKEGEIVTTLPENAKVETLISNDGYVGFTLNDELYYIKVDGKQIKIDLTEKEKEEQIDAETKENNSQNENEKQEENEDITSSNEE